VTRLSGETFGSALTFASVGRASAPGQMDLDTLNTVLDALHA
jgi:3-dehydroquinate dehydratase-1